MRDSAADTAPRMMAAQCYRDAPDTDWHNADIGGMRGQRWRHAPA